MIKAADILTRDEIDGVRAISGWKSAWGIVHAWIVIAGAMALFIYRPNPLTFLVGVAVIGARQLGLAILMHDGAHKLLFKNHKLNDFVSQWFCGYPVMANTLSYRPYHLEHHKNTQQEDDPDLVLSRPFPIGKNSFFRKVVRDLTGQTGVKLMLYNLKRMRRSREASAKIGLSLALGGLEGFLITNAALLAILAAVGQWHVYFLLWLIPWLTVFQLVTRIRSIAEHAVVPDNDDDFRNTRTTLAGPLARAFVAPYNVNYHIEHHLFTFVPWYNLPKVHAILKTKGYVEKMEIGESYWRVLKRATSRVESFPTV